MQKKEKRLREDKLQGITLEMLIHQGFTEKRVKGALLFNKSVACKTLQYKVRCNKDYLLKECLQLLTFVNLLRNYGDYSLMVFHDSVKKEKYRP